MITAEHDLRQRTSGETSDGPAGGQVTRLPQWWAPHGLTDPLVPAAMLCFEAVLLYSSADVPSWIGPVVALLAGCGLFVHARVLESPPVFRSLVAALFVLMLVRLFGFPPPAYERGFVVLPRSLTISAAEFLLACQALVLWRWRRGEALPTAFAGLALATPVLALNKTLGKDADAAYVLLVTVSLLVPTLMIRRESLGSSTAQRRLSRGAQLVTAFVCVCVLLCTMLATQAWSRLLPNAQQWFATTVGRSINTEQRIHRYATSGSLSVIREENASDPFAVALVVHADRTPGYLAGRSFDAYVNGTWINAWEALSGQSRIPWRGLRIVAPMNAPPTGLKILRNAAIFEIEQTVRPDGLRTMVIENDPRRGRVFFTPLGCNYLAGYGDELDVDQHDIVRAGISTRSPYQVYFDPASSSQSLPEMLRRQVLLPPTGLPRSVADLAARVCRDRFTTRDKISAIRDFFQENFEYSLDPVNVPEDTDPLAQFLLTRHPAHCEFFASGAVALLRYQGIPARYVTGYRVVVKKEGEEYWIGRNRDAHAWAEAYDDQQQKWVIVEATPGFVDPAEDELLAAEQAAASAATGGLAFTAQKASQLAQWWQGLPLWIRLPLYFLALGLLSSVLYLSARRARLRVLLLALGDPRAVRWQQCLAVMDRRLKKRGWARAHWETLHQFASRLIESAANSPHDRPQPVDDWLRTTAQWYVDYANSRFRPSCSEPPPLPAAPPRRIFS